MRLLGAWWFVTPSLLWWGLAAAIPVFIHLWSQRRYREVPWAATQFLLAAIRKHQRRLQVEQWLLLATRALLLLCLALALAQPIISGAALGPAWRREPTRHTVLVIDGSYSMLTQHQGQPRFAQAQQRAAELVRGSSSGDTYSLVLMADPPAAIIDRASADHDSVLGEIRDLRVSHGGARLVDALSLTAQMLRQLAAAANQPRPRVHFFTDLGRNTWGEASSEEGRRLLQALNAVAELRLTDVGEGSTDNVAVTNLAVGSRVVVANEAVDLTAEVENFGVSPRSRQKVEWLVDGEPISENYIDLPPGGRLNVMWTHRFDSAGEHLVEVRLREDPLEVDNHRWLALPVRESLRVLCVQGGPHAADYVALALAPLAGTRSTVVPRVAAEHALREGDLAAYDAVFLCNVGRLEEQEMEVLRDYVQRGGGLVISLGDLVQAENYNALLGSAETSLLPARLGEIVADGVHYFNPGEYQHPLVAPFRGHERAGLLTSPVWRYVRLTDPVPQARIPLAFDNGDPAVVEMRVGQGRVLLFATALAPDSVDRSRGEEQPWTAITAWPSFPPLVHEMLRLVSSGRWQRRNVRVGELLSSRVPDGLDLQTARLTTSEEQTVRLQVNLTDRRWSFEDTDRSGVYRARYGEPDTNQELFAVNLDTRESDLTRIDPETLSDYFASDGGDESDIEPESTERPLFRLLLGAVMVLLVSESWLAWRFGKGRQ